MNNTLALPPAGAAIDADGRLFGPGAPTFDISIVVVSSNRKVDLPQLFDACEKQIVPPHLRWELIVVDNRSTDGSAQLIHQFAARAAFPVVYAYEGRQGKSRGLNRGVAVARGRIIALTDDDGVPAPDWLARIDRHFAEHPDIACVGGRVELYDPQDALITVRLSRERLLVDGSSFSIGSIPVIGCNLALDRAALMAVGPFDENVGPGSVVGSGDDADMLYRFVSAGHCILYDPELLVLHNHGRRTAAEVDKVLSRYIGGRGGFYCKYVLRRDRTVLRWAYWETRALLVTAARGGLFSAPARDALRSLAMLAKGAVRYLRFAERAPLDWDRYRAEAIQ